MLVKIKNITKINHKSKQYDIGVENVNNFYADDVLVHNCQNIDINDIVGDTYYVSEKLDGTSFTCYLKDGVFGVCSRNLEIAEPELEFVPKIVRGEDGIVRATKENTHWKIARQMKLKEVLESLNGNCAIQGEIIGEGIQKNRYGLNGQKLFIFNIFDIDNFGYLDQDSTQGICLDHGLETVPFLKSITIEEGTDTQYEENPLTESEIIQIHSVDDLLERAEGKSVLNKNTEREGLVWRSTTRDFSFKTISNKFLLKGGD